MVPAGEEDVCEREKGMKKREGMTKIHHIDMWSR